MVIRLDPSIDTSASVATVFSAVRAAVPGHVVAAVAPRAPIQPAVAARSAAELFWRNRVGMIIAGDDLTEAPSTAQFMPFGADHFFVLPTVPSPAGSSAASVSGDNTDSASTTSDTNINAASVAEFDAVATALSSGVFVHGGQTSQKALTAARAMPRSELGLRVLVDATLVGNPDAVGAALGDGENHALGDAGLADGWFIDLEVAGTELSNATVIRMAESLRGPVRVRVDQLSDAPPAGALFLDESDRVLARSGVAAAVLVPPGLRVPRPSADDEGSAVDRLQAWRDHLDQLIDDARPSLGSAGRKVSLLWAKFSRHVDLAAAPSQAATGSATGSAAGAEAGPDATVDERLAAAGQAYVRAVDAMPSQLTGLPTLAEVLGRAPPLAALPNVAGGQGQAVVAVLAKGVNQLSLNPTGDVGRVVAAWNGWVGSLDPQTDAQTTMDSAMLQVVDVLLQARPSLASVPGTAQDTIRQAAANLVYQGGGLAALQYLAEPDAHRRSVILKAAIRRPAVTPDLLRDLRDLAQATGPTLDSERADINYVGALANALGRTVELSHLDSPLTGQRDRAAALGIDRKLIPKSFTNVAKVDWVDTVNYLIDNNAADTDALKTVETELTTEATEETEETVEALLRTLGIAALDC